MDKRERPIYKGIFFSEQEWQQVATKMAESDMPNFSAFCREMLLTGKVKHLLCDGHSQEHYPPYRQ